MTRSGARAIPFMFSIASCLALFFSPTAAEATEIVMSCKWCGICEFTIVRIDLNTSLVRESPESGPPTPPSHAQIDQNFIVWGQDVGQHDVRRVFNRLTGEVVSYVQGNRSTAACTKVK
jgi:hypothetical protein